MSELWFTADTHFGHERTLELSKRPYSSVEEMNWDMVKKWNSVVKEDDRVYHLGDFGDFKFAKYLNGNITLLFGNYDCEYFKYSDSTNLAQDLMDAYDFQYVHTDNELLKNFNEKVYNLVHEPNNASIKQFKLFGHIHKLQMVKRNGLNVGVDCHNFYPINLDTVEFYRNAIENHYDEEVFGN